MAPGSRRETGNRIFLGTVCVAARCLGAHATELGARPETGQWRRPYPACRDTIPSSNVARFQAIRVSALAAGRELYYVQRNISRRTRRVGPPDQAQPGRHAQDKLYSIQFRRPTIRRANRWRRSSAAPLTAARRDWREAGCKN